MKVNAAETAFSISPGGTNELKVTVKRLHGFKAKVTLSARNLPEGLTLEPGQVPEKGGDMPLKLVASAEKAMRELGWAPKTTLEQLCQMMVEADMRRNEQGFSF